jgi:hypothetical protein
MLGHEPLPARVWVRVNNPDADDYDKVGEIVGEVDMQLGSRRGEWFLVRFEDHEAAYQAGELETCPKPS